MVAERAVLLTGIGGQGVQLAAKTLAFAAVEQGLDAMVFGEYSGVMRGGNTDASVIVGTGRLLMPPTVSSAWAVVAMHHEFWAATEARLAPGGIVIVDSSVFDEPIERTDVTVVAVDCTGSAARIGSPRAGSMVALGALCSATGIVRLDSLQAAARQVLPSYRSQHAEANAVALGVGFDLVVDRIVDAWDTAPVGVQP